MLKPDAGGLSDELTMFLTDFEMCGFELDVENMGKLLEQKLSALVDIYVPHKIISRKKQKKRKRNPG